MSLATKLVAVAAQLGAIHKDKSNDFHKYNYVSAEKFIEVVRGPLMDHGIAIVPKFSASWKDQPSPKGAPGVACHLHACYTITDGEESIEAAVVGEGWDSSGDKASYKAMTGAHKYLLRILFNLPMTDDPEANPPQQRTQAPQQREWPGPQTPPAEKTGDVPEGLRFAMAECPTTKAGDHMFGHPKNPHREKWDTWTWNRLYLGAVEVLKAGMATPDNCGLQNMVEAEFMSTWNREQAVELMARAKAQAGAGETTQADDAMNLDEIPF